MESIVLVRIYQILNHCKFSKCSNGTSIKPVNGPSFLVVPSQVISCGVSKSAVAKTNSVAKIFILVKYFYQSPGVAILWLNLTVFIYDLSSPPLRGVCVILNAT